jgi:hypothetical protein
MISLIASILFSSLIFLGVTLSISAAKQYWNAGILIEINRIHKIARSKPELDGAGEHIGLVIETGYVI